MIANAETVLLITAGAGLIAWIAGLWFVVATARRGRTPQETMAPLGNVPNQISDTADVEGDVTEIADRAAAVLAQGLPGTPWAQVRITDRTADRLRFDVLSLGSTRKLVRDAQVQFAAGSSGKTRVTYNFAPTPGKGLMTGAWIFVAVGFVVLVAGFFLLRTYVVFSPDPAVREQALQMMQVVHFLWPPFLLAGMARYHSRLVANSMQTFLANLAHYRLAG